MFRVMLIVSLVSSLPAFCHGQVVQLPTFHTFGYSGTVEVPDGGTMSLGGNASSSYVSSQRRSLLPGFPSRRGATLGSSASVTATIIDHRETDKQLLGQKPEDFIRQHEAVAIARNQETHNREVWGVKTADRIEEGKALVRHARELLKQKRIDEARYVYEMSLPLLEGHLQGLAIAEMQRLGLR